MQIEHVQFPLLLPEHPLTRAAKVGLGAVAVALFRRRVAELYAGAVGERLSRLDRVLIARLVHRHERSASVERLAPLQRWLWAGDQAVAFHTQAEARFEEWWRRGAACIVEPLQAAIDATPGPYTTLCEIGCGSGLVLEDLRATVRGVSSFLGLDLSPAQIARNRARFADPALRFAAGDVTRWVPAHAERGWIYVTNAGVLEYLTEPQLVALFTHIAQALRPAIFALAEPVAVGHDVPHDALAEPRSRVFGAERTFSHPYVHLLTRCGWTVRWTERRDIAQSPHLLAVATTVD